MYSKRAWIGVGIDVVGDAGEEREADVSRDAHPREQPAEYLQPERGLSIAGMYIQCNQREVYQSPAFIYNAGSIYTYVGA